MLRQPNYWYLSITCFTIFLYEQVVVTMHRYYLFLLLIFLCRFYSKAQTGSAPDTSQYPYWIDMMADPSVNFYKTQRAFELYWQNRAITKGSGYKPFKRWEYTTREIIDSNGNIPAPGTLEAEVEKYLNRRSRYSYGIGYPGIPAAPVNAPCLTSGNWVEIGPRVLPVNGTGQPNGLGRVNAIAFHPTDSLKIYVGTPAGGLWISNDGGKTWDTNTDTFITLGISSIAIDPQHPDTIYLGTGDRDNSDSYGRGVLKSIDGGITWFLVNSGMGNVIVGRLIIDPKNPQILLAATSSGIYRTANGGSSWTRYVSDNFKEIVFDAVNSNYVFATTYSTAEYYRSTDNGITWTKLMSTLPTGKQRLVVATTPADSNLVYLLATNSSTFAGLYLSHDRGVNFKLMSDTPNIMDYSHLGSGTGGQAWYDLDIAADPDDGSIVYSAGVNIFQSTDSGKTWKINAHWVGSGGAPAIHADNHVLEYQPGTNHLFTGNDGGIYFTTDRGKSWTDISEGIGIAQIYRIGQSANNKDFLINGYQDNGAGMYLNGKWTTVMGGDGMDCLIDPTDDAWAYSDLYYGDIRRYKNYGYNGTIGKNGSNGINESGGWITPFILREGDANTMFSGFKNVWRTTNVKAASASSVTWTKISDNLGGSNSQNITVLENSSVDDNLLYMARADNKLFKSVDANVGSVSWTDLTSSLPASGTINWLETHRSFKNRVWICISNKIYQSDDGGNNWTDISSGLPNIPMLCAVYDSSSSRGGLYLGTYMGVFYKDTTMSNWIWYNNNMPVNTRVRDIEIYYSPSGRDKSHVVCGTYGRGNWRSPLYDEDQKTPVAGFTEDMNSICLNQSVSFTDTSLNIPTKWSWEITPNSVTYLYGTDSTSQNPVVQFNQKGKYTVKFWAANCMGVDSFEKVDVIEVFDPIKSPVCTGFTKTIGAYGIGIYGVDIADLHNTSVGPNVEGGYVDRACREIVTLRTDTAYWTTITTGVSYNEYVKVFIDFNNNGNLNDAGEMVFNTPKGKTTHQDSIRIPINPVTNTLLRMRVMSDYDTVKANSCDTMHYGQTEDFGVVIEPRIPIANFGIDTNEICQNGKIILTDSSEGSIYKRRWYVSQDGLLTYKSDSAGPITFTLPDTGWYYAILVLNDSLVSKRIDSIVYVKPNPKANLSYAKGGAIMCERDSLILSDNGFPTTVTHQWYKNGSALPGQTNATLNRFPVFLSDSGSYYSEVNLNGCTSQTNPVQITTKPKPRAGFIPDDTVQCFINNRFGFGNTSFITTSTYSNKWTFGDGAESNLTGPFYSYSDTGNFIVTLITSTSFCSDSISKNIRVNESPVAGFTLNSTPQCLKENEFVVKNISTISNGNLKYLWKWGDSNTDTTTDASHHYSVDGSFDITLITNSTLCSDTLIRNIQVSPTPVAVWNYTAYDSCGKSNLYDFNNSSFITSGSINTNDWKFSDGSNSSQKDVLNKTFADTGNYTVQLIVVSNLGCRDTMVKLIKVHEAPVADFSLTPLSACLKGNSISIANTSSVTSGSITGYEWDFGDGGTSVQQNPAPQKYGNAGTFNIQLVVHSSTGCDDTLQKSIDIYPNPLAGFTVNTGCEGAIITFTNTSSIASGSIKQSFWKFGDGDTSGLNDPTHIFTKPGSFEITLVVASDHNCKDSIVAKNGVTILPKPKADFSFQRLSSAGTATDVQFQDLTDTAVLWNWNFSGIALSTDQNPLVTFPDSGSYVIILKVENKDGCEDSINRIIFISPINTFYVPNGFTPNGDGLNEIFKPYGLSYLKKYNMSVYDRWGIKVFETENPQEGWDGKYLGEYVLSGMYLVTIEYIDLNGERAHEELMIQVMR